MRADVVVSRWRSIVLTSLAIVASGVAIGLPSVVRADASVVVLGLTSLEGDDEYARNLSGAVRHAATQVHGWQVSERDVTLSQMELAHACDDGVDAACLGRIATALGVQRLVYGTVSRVAGSGARHDFAISLHLFNAETGETTRDVNETLPGSRTDIDDLREPARRFAAQLDDVPHVGTIVVSSDAPDAEVLVDGVSAGRTDSSGALRLSDVQSGPHAIRIVGRDGRDVSSEVTVESGTAASVQLALGEGGGGGGGGGGEGGGGGGGPYINWAGWAFVAGGALALVGSIYSWARLDGINNSAEFNQYGTREYPIYGYGAGDVNRCEAASAGALSGPGDARTQMDRASRVASLCSEGATLEILQYVFLAVAVGAGATGVILLLTDQGPQPDRASVSIRPSFGEHHGYVDLSVQF